MAKKTLKNTLNFPTHDWTITQGNLESSPSTPYKLMTEYPTVNESGRIATNEYEYIDFQDLAGDLSTVLSVDGRFTRVNLTIEGEVQERAVMGREHYISYRGTVALQSLVTGHNRSMEFQEMKAALQK